MNPIVSVLVVAAVATAGDFIWYAYGVQHTIVAGLVHGALLLTAVGAVLGTATGRTARGLPIGALAGIGGATVYYLLVAVTDGGSDGFAILAAWFVLWLILATLDGRWLRASEPRTWAAIAGRGLTASLVGGVAFYLVLDILWGPTPTGDRNYLVQFVAWAFAWAPGLLALTLGQTPEARSVPPPTHTPPG